LLELTVNDLEKILFPIGIIKKLSPYLKLTDVTFEKINEAKEKMKLVTDNIE